MRILINRPIVALAALTALSSSACGDAGGASSRPTITLSPAVQNPAPTTPAPLPPPVIQPTTPAPFVPPVVTPSTGVPTTVAPVVPPTTTTPVVNPPVGVPTTVTPPVTPTPVPPPATPEPDEPAAECSGEGEPGIPQTETGWFPATSNKSCFQGSWYCFDDGEVPTSCVKDTPPWNATEMSMCLDGATIVDTTYAAWGAGIGASLNDQDGDKELFDAEAAGIKGFKFTVSGDLGGAVLKFKVPRSTKDQDSPPEYVVDVGANSVEFSDLAPPDWDEVGDDLDPAELTELKWQIAGGDAEAEYSFCISNLEPIYE